MSGELDVDVKTTDLVYAYFDSFAHSNINSVGKVVEGKIINIDRKKGIVIVDAGLRSEAVLSIKEFYKENESANLKVGDKIDLYVMGNDTIGKTAILSRENAIKEESKMLVKEAFEKDETIEGIPFAKVKSGISVDIGGFIAFLPGSQIDENNVNDISDIIGKKQKFKIVSFDGKNAVISRKKVLDDSYQSAREAFYASNKEGSIIEGKVRNITDYGAFIDLGFGVDALVHVVDISWDRINHPSEVMKIGDTVKAKIIKLDEENDKIAVSMKLLTENNWSKLIKNIEIGSIVSGSITSIEKYGIFVEVANGIDGLIHFSELSWNNDDQNKLEEYKVGDKIDAMVIDIDIEKQKIALSVRRLTRNPFKDFAEANAIGTEFEGEIKKIIDYGFFVAVGEIEGFVSIDNIAWLANNDILSMYKVGDKVKVSYLSVDDKFVKIAFGIKQLVDNPFEKNKDLFVVGNNVTCTVIALKPDRIDVKVVDGVYSSIKKSNLSRDKSDQRIDRFTIGDKVDAKIIAFDLDAKKLILSIKEFEEEEYNKIIKKYGGENTGASIADILGIEVDKVNKQ